MKHLFVLAATLLLLGQVAFGQTPQTEPSTSLADSPVAAPVDPPISEPVAEPTAEAPIEVPTEPTPTAAPEEPPAPSGGQPLLSPDNIIPVSQGNSTNGTSPEEQAPVAVPTASNRCDPANRSDRLQLTFSYMDWAAVIVLWVVGLLFVFIGYRIFKPIIFMVGFISCFAIVYLASAGNTNWTCGDLWYLPMVLGFVGALIGGFLFLCITQIGIFFIGFCFGVTVASVLLATPLGTSVLTLLWQHLLITLGAGAGLGILALFLQKTLIIVGTSVFGAYMIACGVDMKFLNPPILSQLIPHMLAGQGFSIDWDNVQNKAFPYLLLGGLVIFAIAGIIVQFFWTGKGYDHKTGKRVKQANEDNEPLLPRTITVSSKSSISSSTRRMNIQD